MKNIKVIYWSSTGNTESMAKAVAEGVRSTGAAAELWEVSEINAADISSCPLLALGCPAMGDEELEEGEFAPFFDELEPHLAGKTVALFGSYDWGDGQWMRDWQERTAKAGAVIINGGNGLIINNTPEEADLESCRRLGAELAEQ